ncbi:MAG: alpha/beta hydrolase family protein [Vitreoscilla sp.]
MNIARRPLFGSALIAIAACLGLVAGPAATASPTSAASPFKAGEMAGQASSHSAAVRNHGNPDIRMLVWYPVASSEVEQPLDAGGPVFVAGAVAGKAPFADAMRHPVVLLSHGFGGTARQMTWLGTALARAGYVAVAVDHPGTNGIDGITPQGAYAPWERVGDLVAALDLVLGDPVIAPHVDGNSVGVAGFSMGGFTGALIVGARTDFGNFNAFCRSPKRDAICEKQTEFPLDYTQMRQALEGPAMTQIREHEQADLQDRRVKAAFLIDPALGPAISLASLRQVQVPVTVLYGTADAIAPPRSNALLIGGSIAGATLVPLPNVGHYDFLSECSDAARQGGLVYCADGAGRTRHETHERTSAAAIEFFDLALHVKR